MNLNLFSGIFFSFLLSINADAQDNPNIKFGDISIKDFEVPASAVVDSNTNGVILANIGSTDFIGNKYHSFSFVYKRYVRIKIINNKAFNLSSVKFRLYGSKEYKDQLSDLKAVTYNIENGKVIMSELSKTDVFEDRLSSYTTIMKFTMPSVKEGSIIEYSYTITSYHSSNIPSWFFQHFQYPCLYSEYKLICPDALRFFTVRYGLDSFSMNKTSIVKNKEYTMGDISVISNDIMSLWVMKEIPAFREEKFINSPIDYFDKIEFFLAQAYNGRDIQDISNSWETVTDQLLSADYFGAAIDKGNAINLLNTTEKITSGDKTLMESARHLYYYVRDNFTCSPDDEIYIGNDLYEVNKKKKGTVAELNLLLAALLRQKGILVDPVILSTMDYGKNPADYPVLDKMNYVICMMRFAGDTIYLDASRPCLGFGKLSIDCYNGHARIISKNGGPLYFSPAKITEQRNTSVFIFNDEKEGLGGTFESFHDFFESEKLRKEIKKSNEKKYFDNLKSGFTGEIEILNTGIDSLYKTEFPAKVHFNFKVPVSGDIFYFNPLVVSEYNKNPFASEQRRYPVTLPYPIDDLYILNMEIPEGYTVDELPKSAKVSYNGDEGIFEYIVEKDQSTIQFRSHIKLNEIVFRAEDYQSLRDFFAFIVKKYNEQIVFKRKK